MVAPYAPPRQLYNAWVEDQIEEFKASLTREELLQLADQAVHDLFADDDGQYPLTEILLRDAVDALVFRQLQLPSYRRWLRSCQIDTGQRPRAGTTRRRRAAGGGT
ncbi:MAG: hypothetical protein HY561_03615 [Gemmatimonadetes bacterium]|nr:hypothetical protein [Gemmatimonadota bacterium]